MNSLCTKIIEHEKEKERQIIETREKDYQKAREKDKARKLYVQHVWKFINSVKVALHRQIFWMVIGGLNRKINVLAEKEKNKYEKERATQKINSILKFLIKKFLFIRGTKLIEGLRKIAINKRLVEFTKRIVIIMKLNILDKKQWVFRSLRTAIKSNKLQYVRILLYNILSNFVIN